MRKIKSLKNLSSLTALLIDLLGDRANIEVDTDVNLVLVFSDDSDMFSQVRLKEFYLFSERYCNVSWYVSVDVAGRLYAAFYLK